MWFDLNTQPLGANMSPLSPPTFAYCFLLGPTSEAKKYTVVCPEPFAYRQMRRNDV